jgi:hypothetical protein
MSTTTFKSRNVKAARKAIPEPIMRSRTSSLTG